jgi:hypothetical protein
MVRIAGIDPSNEAKHDSSIMKSRRASNIISIIIVSIICSISLQRILF